MSQQCIICVMFYDVCFSCRFDKLSVEKARAEFE